MAYTCVNFKTKKALKEAVKEGRRIMCLQPGPFGDGTTLTTDGVVFLEGPHYPAPHRWYAKGYLKDGALVKVE